MKRLFLFGMFSALSFGQGGNMLMLKFSGVPSGSCVFFMQAIDGANGNLYYCPAGSWVQVTGGGGGGSPGGATNSVQYNAGGGTFGGITNLTTNGTNPLLTAIAAPASPSAGFGVLYEDSTSLNLAFRNASGTINHGVQTANSVSHNFLTAIADNGSVSLAQPACGDLSDSGTACTAVAPQNTTSTAHNFFTAYTASTGAFTKAQPACADLSDSSTGCSASSLPPNGTAGGDLSGTYPNPTVNQVEGAAIPTSAHVTGTNSSKQLIASTGHDASAILTCAAASASGTAYTCSTSPTFTPASGDAVLFKADVANTGSATLAVNSASAATIKKQGGGTNLAANDLLIGSWTPMQFDGTNWQMEGQIGNAASGGGASRGVFASRPSCSTSGSVYYSTDIPLVSECNGTSWQDWAFNIFINNLPANTSFTWQSQGSCTVTVNGIAYITAPPAGANLCLQNITLPATPFTIDACFYADNLLVAFSQYGFYESDGTKLFSFENNTGASSNQIRVGKWNSVSSYNSDAVTQQGYIGASGNKFCLRWNDDGVNANFSHSADGLVWTAFGSVGRTSWLTPTTIGWGGSSTSANSEPTNFFLTNWYKH